MREAPVIKSAKGGQARRNEVKEGPQSPTPNPKSQIYPTRSGGLVRHEVAGRESIIRRSGSGTNYQFSGKENLF